MSGRCCKNRPTKALSPGALVSRGLRRCFCVQCEAERENVFSNFGGMQFPKSSINCDSESAASDVKPKQTSNKSLSKTDNQLLKSSLDSETSCAKSVKNMAPKPGLQSSQTDTAATAKAKLPPVNKTATSKDCHAPSEVSALFKTLSGSKPNTNKKSTIKTSLKSQPELPKEKSAAPQKKSSAAKPSSSNGTNGPHAGFCINSCPACVTPHAPQLRERIRPSNFMSFMFHHFFEDGADTASEERESAILYDEHYECTERHCVRCLLEDNELYLARRKLKKTFTDEEFLSAEDGKNQRSQAIVVRQIHDMIVVSEDYPVDYIGFEDLPHFVRWLFKAGLVRAYVRILKNHLQEQDPVDVVTETPESQRASEPSSVAFESVKKSTTHTPSKSPGNSPWLSKTAVIKGSSASENTQNSDSNSQASNSESSIPDTDREFISQISNLQSVFPKKHRDECVRAFKGANQSFDLAVDYLIDDKFAEYNCYGCESIPHYIMYTLVWMLIPRHRQINDSDIDEDEEEEYLPSRKEFAWHMSQSAGLVAVCLQYLSKPRTMFDIIDASMLLEMLAQLSTLACDRLLEIGVLDIIVELATPGKLQKRVAKARDAGFSYATKEIVFEKKGTMDFSKKDSLEWKKAVEDYPEFYVYRDVLQMNHVAQSSLVILHSLAQHVPQPKCCLQVFHLKGCVNVALRWLRQPPLADIVEYNAASEASSLLAQFVDNSDLAKELIEEKDIMKLVDRVLFTSDASALTQHIQLLAKLCSSAVSVRQKLYENRHLMLAIGCHIHSRYKTVQDNALLLLVVLIKRRPSVLHLLASLGVVNELMLMPYFVGDWETPVPQLAAMIQELGRKTLRSKWKFPHVAAFMPCKEEEFEISKLRKRGNDCFKEACYEEAIRCYTSALILARMEREMAATLFSNRAECHLRKQRYQEVVRDTTLALGQHIEKLKPRIYVKTLFRRAKAFDAIGRPFEALEDISICLYKQPQEENFGDLHTKVLNDFKSLDGAVYKSRKCEKCGYTSYSLRKCANCDVHFCSKNCQKQAWSEHRKICAVPNVEKTTPVSRSEKEDQNNNFHGVKNVQTSKHKTAIPHAGDL